ncbi:hypothetical protein conserved [Entamoeba histolytica]|uniref:DDB1- and CUL4-associated factor 13 n=1 Tax=Entamoeba histolytica TaxID=5759 RepID=A0A175K0N2_ENTHI|nr:hypothetical protein conserved [Entamoeba histolytica]
MTEPQGFDPTKFKLITRNVLTEYKELLNDLARVQRSMKEEDHPFAQAREYKRALNATKLDKIFAKPFIGNLAGHPDGVTCITRTGNEISYMASGGYDGEVRVWNVGTNNVCILFKHMTQFVKELVFLQQKYHILLHVQLIIHVNYGHYQFLQKKIVNQQKAPLMTYNHEIPFSCIDTRRGTEDFCTGTSEGLDLWTFSRNEIVQHYDTETDGVLGCKISPTENNVVGITGGNRSIILIDLRANTPIKTVYGVRRYNDLSWNPQQVYMFTACSDDWNLYTYDIRRLNEARTIHKGHLGPVLTVDYSPTGREFATGSYDKCIRIYNEWCGYARDCYHTQRMQKVFNVCYSGDGHYIFSGSDEGNIRIWKAFASESTKIKDKREIAKLNYLNGLKKKYKDMPEIRRIANHIHLPKELMHTKTIRDTMILSEKKKELNRKKHAKKERKTKKEKEENGNEN